MKLLIALITGFILGLFCFQLYHNINVKVAMNTIEPIIDTIDPKPKIYNNQVNELKTNKYYK